MIEYLVCPVCGRRIRSKTGAQPILAYKGHLKDCRRRHRSKTKAAHAAKGGK